MVGINSVLWTLVRCRSEVVEDGLFQELQTVVMSKDDSFADAVSKSGFGSFY